MINSKGDFFVADSGNGRIVHLTRPGRIFRNGAARAKRRDNSRRLMAWPSTRDDRIYVADRGNNRVQVFYARRAS